MALSRESSPAALFEPPSSPPPLPSGYSRKRSRSPTLHDHSQGSSSSDAFLFSSDDAPEGVENYEIPTRRKRQYVGTWWAHQAKPARSPKRTPRPRAKKKLSRNNDSGVWLSSESSDDSAIERLATAPRPVLFGSVPRAQNPPTEQDNAAGHARAHEKIQACLEDGKESVDLSGMRLGSIPDELIQPLAQLIRNPRVGAEVPKEDSYQSFTPSLKIFLSQNELRAVPMSVWNLENLSVLSLRNNKLEEIPPAIANLKNLTELNLAGNKLRWLPWELLRLVAPSGKLACLNVTPNRFFQGGKFSGTLQFSDDPQQMLKKFSDLRDALDDPEQAASREQIAWSIRLYETLLKRMETRDPAPTPRHECPAWKREPAYITSTPVARMNFDGSLQRNSPVPPSRASRDVSILPAAGAGHTPAMELANLPNKTRVPSLYELSLRAAAGTSSPHTLRNFLSDESSPDPVVRGLEEMERVLNAGGRICSVCSKPYIQPGAEWVEYWHCADTLFCGAEDSFVPFLRRACSLGCAAAVNGGEVQE
ncbi:hypothetical protein IWX90DRAFT_482300 [Phyllosticta citrichinensis]|uniref:Uncharacterized protein n=1 Tax=Phyllosticta citrichinensis TaxID=1130410 RepID=A0ABR1Y5U5_9PEZI